MTNVHELKNVTSKQTWTVKKDQANLIVLKTWTDFKHKKGEAGIMILLFRNWRW